jgi:DNA-binding NarL/FixJ family response regulator
MATNVTYPVGHGRVTVWRLVAVLFVEDDARYQRSIAALFPSSELQLTFASSGREALRLLSSVEADVCVVDLGLPDMMGDELIRQISRLRPALPIVVLSVVSSEAKIIGALRAGAAGYLLKEDAARLLPRAIDEARLGGAPMSASVAKLVLSELRASSSQQAPASAEERPLTRREIEVVEHLARGLSYENVATALGISANTVRAHIRSIYDKLVVASKTEAVMVALRLGLLQAHA